MRISDWSSDVCSADLQRDRKQDLFFALLGNRHARQDSVDLLGLEGGNGAVEIDFDPFALRFQMRATGIAELNIDTHHVALDRKSVVSGKSVSVSVDLGGRRIFQKKNNYNSPSL